MKYWITAIFFSLSAFSFNAFSLYTGSSEGSNMVSCWRCIARNATTTWESTNVVKSKALNTSLNSCKAKTKKSSCQKPACYEFSAYEGHGCGTSTSYATNSPNDDYTSPIPGPSESDNRCSSSMDCRGFDVCVRGKCVYKNGSENRCNTGMDCSAFESCLNGRCGRAGKDGCNGNYDCGGLQICVGKKCIDKRSSDNRCFSDFDCPTFSHCTNSRCQ